MKHASTTRYFNGQVKAKHATRLNMNQRIAFIEESEEFSTQKYRSETDLKLVPDQIIFATSGCEKGQEASPCNYRNSSPLF